MLPNADLHESTPERYDRPTIVMHWLMTLLVIVQWTIGRTTGLLPRGPLRVDIWSVHVLLGVSIALVLVARIVWRLRRGRRLPGVGTALERAAASIVHIGLYVVLAVVVVLGFANTYVHGFPLFNVLTLPGKQDLATILRVNNWHGFAANVLAVLILLHTVAALFHHYVRRDGVLRRMGRHPEAATQHDKPDLSP
ncbi:cytochrome b [Luteibacter sp. NPDC031894]|uniref:cytochrome b n=1 Tax=Luteibacter sp. NPDC031894 TaxID=3390572 RepID=UPI003CFCBAF3